MEVRKRVSELKVGDEVKGYGKVVNLSCYGSIADVHRVDSYRDHWPADAEVTVIVPDTEYRITVTYASRDRRALENCWPTSTQCDGWVNEKVRRTVGEIDEVTL